MIRKIKKERKFSCIVPLRAHLMEDARLRVWLFSAPTMEPETVVLPGLRYFRNRSDIA